MRFIPTSLVDAWLIEPTPAADTRGAFARTFCTREFAAQGLETTFVQHSASTSSRKGTVRGMHFQTTPHQETKLVRCVRGAIHDVIVDLRPGSPTYLKSAGFELMPANGRQLYVPRGFAHGFQTLADDTEVTYLISTYYEPGAAAGYRFDDPAFAIEWPLPVAVISDKDLAWPAFDTETSVRST